MCVGGWVRVRPGHTRVCVCLCVVFLLPSAAAVQSPSSGLSVSTRFTSRPSSTTVLLSLNLTLAGWLAGSLVCRHRLLFTAAAVSTHHDDYQH